MTRSYADGDYNDPDRDSGMNYDSFEEIDDNDDDEEEFVVEIDESKI